MNPNLDKLQSYPFAKLNRLKNGISPPAGLAHISLSIGEPKHPTPALISNTLRENLDGLACYPATRGMDELRGTIAAWLVKRFQLPQVEPGTQVLPVNGTREALFSFAQAVVSPNVEALVLLPNPFYQIYEGAALLAGAQPYYVNASTAKGGQPDFTQVPDSAWKACQLLYICSPGNPTGAVMPLEDLQYLIRKADTFDFIIAADECYSELYCDEQQPPPSLLQAAAQMGREGFKRCVVFHSLSKRSNAPGLRSGFVAGDAQVLEKYFLYRTYHGCAMPPPIQMASIAAWRDEEHVRENRLLYRQKFTTFMNVLNPVLPLQKPPAGFYLWVQTPMPDEDFSRLLFAEQHVTVLPGSYLSRHANGVNPGASRVRIALVAETAECEEAAWRIRNFITAWHEKTR